MIEIIVEEQIDEALSQKDALRMALAKHKFKRAGGKTEKLPPSPATGSNKYRGWSMATPKTKEDEKMAKDIQDYKKKKKLQRHNKFKAYAKKEDVEEEIMSTSSDVDMNPTGKSKKKRKCETFSVSDDCFNKFKNGKTKFERWSKYLDLTDNSQKKIYDWAKRHHNGSIILKNSVTGQIRGIRYNRTGGGQWGKITRLKEQVLKTNNEFTVK
jgi:hypothetical protein